MSGKDQATDKTNGFPRRPMQRNGTHSTPNVENDTAQYDDLVDAIANGGRE